VKFKYVIAILSLVAQPAAYSASFTTEDEVVTSSISVKTIDCGNYKVDLNHETFPFKYENDIPREFMIKGFYGSPTTIAKQAIIQPAGIVVPNPNDLIELKSLYPEGRTYLAGSAACNGNQLFVSYWSGGNCSQCEAFVSFTYSDSELSSPKKLTYRDFKEISK